MTIDEALPIDASVDWLLDLLDKGRNPTVSDVEERFSPDFLRSIPAPQVVEFLSEGARELQGWTVQVKDSASPHEMVLILKGEQEGVVLHVSVEKDEPHRFTGLMVTPMPNESWSWERAEGMIRSYDWSESELSPEFAERIGEVRDQHRLVGMVAGIARNGKVLHRQALGVTSLGEPEALSMSSVFRAGSITKVVTSLGLCRLAELGRISLDDPVSEHLRSFALSAFATDDPPITIRHVLAHVGGLPRDQGNPDQATSLAELVGGELRAVAPPAQEVVYSNIGFGMLGQLIADVTDQPFAEWIEKNVLMPCGLTGSSVDAQPPKTRVEGYSRVGTTLFPASPEVILDEGAGALSSTVDDLMRLAEVVTNQGAGLLSPDLIEGATTPQFPELDGGTGTGLGFALLDLDGRRVVWHNGGVPGWKSAWYISPDDRTVVVLMATYLRTPLDQLAREILSAIK